MFQGPATIGGVGPPVRLTPWGQGRVWGFLLREPPWGARDVRLALALPHSGVEASWPPGPQVRSPARLPKEFGVSCFLILGTLFQELGLEEPISSRPPLCALLAAGPKALGVGTCRGAARRRLSQEPLGWLWPRPSLGRGEQGPFCVGINSRESSGVTQAWSAPRGMRERGRGAGPGEARGGMSKEGHWWAKGSLAWRVGPRP